MTLCIAVIGTSAQSCWLAEACKNPSLDGLWIYGMTLSSGRICYDYRNKYAFGLAKTMLRLLRPLGFRWPGSHSYYTHTNTRADRAHRVVLGLRQSRCGGMRGLTWSLNVLHLLLLLYKYWSVSVT